jgi:hypothetical protein
VSVKWREDHLDLLIEDAPFNAGTLREHGGHGQPGRAQCGDCQGADKFHGLPLLCLEANIEHLEIFRV